MTVFNTRWTILIESLSNIDNNLLNVSSILKFFFTFNTKNIIQQRKAFKPNALTVPVYSVLNPIESKVLEKKTDINMIVRVSSKATH